MDSDDKSPGNLNHINDNFDELPIMGFRLMDLDFDFDKELEKQLGDPIMEFMDQLGLNEPPFAFASGGGESASFNCGPVASSSLPSASKANKKKKSGRVGEATAPTPAGKARKRQPRPQKIKLWQQDPAVEPDAKGAITARARRERVKAQTLDLQLEVQSLKLQLQAEKASNEELRREVAKLKAERGRNE